MRPIACSKVQRCDITWNVDIENNQCPCTFGISFCADGVTQSFWWSWYMLNVPKYIYFLDFGGINTFHNAQNSHQPRAYHVYRSPNRWNNLSPKYEYGKWQHVVIMIQSNWMTVYVNGIFTLKMGIELSQP